MPVGLLCATRRFSLRFDYEHRCDALGKSVSSETSSHVELWPQANEGIHSWRLGSK